MGYSLDNLSLMALTIAVGFVVDDAIVMLENIYRHIEAGLTPREAALKGAGEIGFTIISISVSLIAVFIPLLLMSGIIGRLFREFAIVVTLTIVVSAFVSLTLSPMMCSLFLRDERHVRHGRLYNIVEGLFDGLVARYTQGLDWVLAHQRITLAVFLITLCSTVVLYVVVPKGFFPQQDTGLISGLSDAAQDISFSQMVKVQHRLTDIIAKDPDVASYAASVGGTRPINNGFLIMSLKPRDERKSSADEVIRRLRQKFNSVSGGTAYLQAVQDINMGGRTTRTQYQYTLQDSDLNELNTWAPTLLKAMQKLPELRDVASDQQTNSTKVSLVIDRDQASRFGIQPQLIDATLYDAFGQRQVAQYFTQLNAYHVILEVPPALQGDPGSLDKLYIKSPLTGQMVPLSSVAHYDTSQVASLSINHQGQFPSVTLSFNLAPGVALGQAVDAIDRTASEIRLPEGVIGSFQGSAQAFQDSLRSEPLLVLAALVVVYIILGMLYESYIHPLTILSTLPSAGVGALLMLIIFHFDLSVIALIGIILLIGIVKKNGIMMVDFALQAERERHLAPEQSIREACLMRFRPIMMTTMSAILGALPLMLGRGTGSEMRVPLGYTMVGGLVLSQALTLFTTPVIYLYLDRLRLRFSGPRADGGGGNCDAGDPTGGSARMKMLLVEDNERVTRFVTKGLQEAGHTADHADNGRDGLFLAASERYDVIIMDRMLPGNIDGLSLISALRQSGNQTPILILSALADVDERIKGLRAGGDDYLTKPFAFGELLARLDALGRRTRQDGTITTLEVADLNMDLLSRKVLRGARQILLQPREFKLLEYLMRHAGQVVTRTMLLENVWDYHFDPQTNVVDVHISKLRQKIEPEPERSLLRTVRNAGYMLSAE